jgi:3-hydroxyacyl-[acyl-carrier-protein] dehydratase
MLEGFSEKIEINFTDASFEVKLKINPKHPLYKGHFPAQKVTPAVVIVHLFKEITQNFVSKKLDLKEASNLKFLAVLNPDENPELLLTGTLEETENFLVLTGFAKTNVETIAKVKLKFLSQSTD